MGIITNVAAGVGVTVPEAGGLHLRLRHWRLLWHPHPGVWPQHCPQAPAYGLHAAVLHGNAMAALAPSAGMLTVARFISGHAARRLLWHRHHRRPRHGRQGPGGPRRRRHGLGADAGQHHRRALRNAAGRHGELARRICLRGHLGALLAPAHLEARAADRGRGRRRPGPGSSASWASPAPGSCWVRSSWATRESSAGGATSPPGSRLSAAGAPRCYRPCWCWPDWA